MAGTTNADVLFANGQSGQTDTDNLSTASGEGTQRNTDQIMYVQLRPGAQLLRKCLGHLERTKRQHPSVQVQVAGFTDEGHQYLITLGVNLGPREQIAKFSDTAIAGYNFVSAVLTDMFDFLPQYAPEPTPAERDRVADLRHLLAPGSNAGAVATG